MTDDENTKHLAEIGLGQVVRKVLQNAGWRAVGGGYFVNQCDCKSLGAWKRIIRHAHNRALAATETEQILREYEGRQLAIAGIERDEFIEEPTWTDLVKEMEANAV